MLGILHLCERFLGDYFVKAGVKETDGALNQIAHIGEELVIIFLHEVVPEEVTVCFLGTVDQHIISPYLAGQVLFKLFGVVAENSHSSALAELLSLIVKIFSGRDGV